MNFLSNIGKEVEKENIEKNIIDIEIIDKMIIDLDSDQRKVVEADFKPILCNAIAGSGKTRVLTYRLSYLLAKGINPSEIILLTFTNKAAKEMVERVVKLTNINPKDLMGGTFHHIAGRFLRKYADHLGYKSNFTIYTPEDSKDLLKWITSEETKEYEGLKRNFPKSNAIYNIYSNSINKNRSIDEILEENGLSEQVNELVFNIINKYIEHKKVNNIMDFDDLLVNFEKLLKIKEIRDRISSRYQYLFVDEYQDVNDLQASIVKLLNNNNPNIFVVGDLNQSIYEFRGSNIENIIKFRNEYKDCQVFPLRYNYRSQGAILDLASNSINRNKQQDKVEMLAYVENMDKPQVRAYKTVFSEAESISKTILDKRRNDKDFKFRDNAILVRNNVQTNALEFAFKRNNIPFRLLSGKSFVERKHVRDIIAFLKFYANPKDEVSFIRALGLFDGCGDITISKILHNMVKPNNEDIETFLVYSVFSPIKLSAKAQASWNNFVRLMNDIHKENTIEGQINVILNKFYNEYIEKYYDKKDERLEDIKFLIDMSKIYSDLNIFIENLLLENTSEEDSDEEDKVIVTTLHKSKGLEWKNVFMPNLNNGVFPKYVDYQIEESRRLFYVGVTRAKVNLYLSFIYTEDVSVFLSELNENVFEYIK